MLFWDELTFTGLVEALRLPRIRDLPRGDFLRATEVTNFLVVLDFTDDLDDLLSDFASEQLR